MARARKNPRTLELADRDFRRLQLALEDLEEADTRAERRDAEAALESLAERLELDDDLLDDLIAGDVELRDDDDEADDDDDRGKRSSSRRRADDDDDAGRSKRRTSSSSSSSSRRRDDDDGRRSSSASSRRVRVVERDDDGDGDDDDRSRSATSLKDLRDRPASKPARRRKDAEPARTPETTHWFHKRLGSGEVAS